MAGWAKWGRKFTEYLLAFLLLLFSDRHHSYNPHFTTPIKGKAMSTSSTHPTRTKNSSRPLFRPLSPIFILSGGSVFKMSSPLLDLEQRAKLLLPLLSDKGTSFRQIGLFRACSKTSRSIANIHILEMLVSKQMKDKDKRDKQGLPISQSIRQSEFRLLFAGARSLKNMPSDLQGPITGLLLALSLDFKKELLLRASKVDHDLAGSLFELPLLDFMQVQGRRIYHEMLQSRTRDGDVSAVRWLFQKRRTSPAPSWLNFRALIPTSFESSLLIPSVQSENCDMIRVLLFESGFRDAADSLIAAVRQGCLQAVQALVESDVSVDVIGGDSCETPLIAACRSCVKAGDQRWISRIEIVKFLAARAGEFHTCDSRGNDAFQAAASIPDGDVSAQVMDILFSAPAFNREKACLNSALCCAILAKNMQTARALVDRGARIPDNNIAKVVSTALKTSSGVATLMQCRDFSVNLNANIDFNGFSCSHVSQTSITALHFAAVNNFTDAVVKLLEYNASPLATAKNGQSVLHMVLDRVLQEPSSTPTLRLLLESIPRSQREHFVVQTDSTSGHSPLQRACKKQNKRACDLLLRNSPEELDILDHVQNLSVKAQTSAFQSYFKVLRKKAHPKLQGLVPFLKRAGRQLARQEREEESGPAQEGTVGAQDGCAWLWHVAQIVCRVQEDQEGDYASDSEEEQEGSGTNLGGAGAKGNTEMLALCIEEENALEILSSALGRRGNLALTRDVLPVIVSAASRQSGSWEAIEHQLIARFDGILGRFRSPIKFLEDADKDVSGWSALNLNARIVAPSQLGFNSFNAKYGTTEYEGHTNGHFRINHANTCLELPGSWRQPRTHSSGRMKMTIALERVCACSSCSKSLSSMYSSSSISQGFYWYRGQSYTWRWKYQGGCESEDELGCLVAELADLSQDMRLLAQNQEAALKLREHRTAFGSLVDKCCALELWSVALDLLKADNAPPPGIAKAVFDYANHFTKDEVYRTLLGRFLAVDCVLQQAQLPLAEQQHPIAQLTLPSNETVLSLAIENFEKDPQSKVFTEILSSICKALAAGNTKWNTVTLASFCKLCVSSATRKFGQAKVLMILEKCGTAPFLQKEGDTSPLLTLVNSGCLMPLVQILKQSENPTSASTSLLPATSTRPTTSSSPSMLDLSTLDILGMLPPSSTNDPRCNCGKYDSDEDDNESGDEVPICVECGWEMVRGSCVYCCDLGDGSRNACTKCTLAHRALLKELPTCATCDPWCDDVKMTGQVVRVSLCLRKPEHRDATGASPLVLAIKHGCWQLAQQLIALDEGSGLLRSSDSAARSPLLLAVGSKAEDEERRQVISALLKAGAEDTPDSQGRTALQTAIANNDTHLVTLLLSHPGALRRSIASPKGTLHELYGAFRKSSGDEVEQWISCALRAGADPSDLLPDVLQTKDKVTLGVLAAWCVSQGCCEVQLATALRMLLGAPQPNQELISSLLAVQEAGYLVERASSLSQTQPLSVAVTAGNVDTVTALLQHQNVRAGIDARDILGRTALHLACALNGETGTKMVRVLLDFGCNRAVRTARGKHALLIAVEHRNAETVEVLLASAESSASSSSPPTPSEVNAKAQDGTTALHAACGALRQDCSPLLVSALVQRRADVRMATPEGVTPLMLACKSANEAAIRAILDAAAGAERATDAKQRTACQYLPPAHDISIATILRLIPSSEFGGMMDALEPAQAAQFVERLQTVSGASPNVNVTFLDSAQKRKLEEEASASERATKRFRHSCVSDAQPCVSCSQCVLTHSKGQDGALSSCFDCHKCKDTASKINYSFDLGCGFKRKRKHISAAKKADDGASKKSVLAVKQAARKRHFLTVCRLMTSEPQSLPVQIAGMRALARAVPTGIQRRWKESKVWCKRLEQAGVLLAAESAARKHVASAELVRHALRLLYRLIQFEDSKALSETLNPEASDASLLDMALRCMERHCDNAPIQDHGLQVIDRLLTVTAPVNLNKDVLSRAKALAQAALTSLMPELSEQGRGAACNIEGRLLHSDNEDEEIEDDEANLCEGCGYAEACDCFECDECGTKIQEVCETCDLCTNGCCKCGNDEESEDAEDDEDADSLDGFIVPG